MDLKKDIPSIVIQDLLCISAKVSKCVLIAANEGVGTHVRDKFNIPHSGVPQYHKKEHSFFALIGSLSFSHLLQYNSDGTLGSQPGVSSVSCQSYNKGSNWLTNHPLGYEVRMEGC